MNSQANDVVKSIGQRATFLAVRLVFVAGCLALFGNSLNRLVQPNLPQSIQQVLENRNDPVEGTSGSLVIALVDDER